MFVSMNQKLILATVLAVAVIFLSFFEADGSASKRLLVRLWEMSQHNVQSDDYLRTQSVVMNSADLFEDILFAEVGANHEGVNTLSVFVDTDKDAVAEVMLSISNSSELIHVLTDTNGDGSYDSQSLVYFGVKGPERIVQTTSSYGKCQGLNVEHFRKSSWEAGISESADASGTQELLGSACTAGDSSVSFKVHGTRDSFGRPNILSIEITIDKLSRVWFLDCFVEKFF